MKGDFITGTLPKTVSIDGKEYPIRYDFRIGMQFERIQNSGTDDRDRVIHLLQIYYPGIPANVTEAINQMLWFYRCGEPEEEEEEAKKKRQRYQRRNSRDPAFSFAQDAPYIYAAFKEQYGIDLTGADLHWWKFMALFESLNEETKMSKIMYYRKANTSGLPRERRAFLNEMKKLYQITDLSGEGKKMSLEARNRKWMEYVRTRQMEAGMVK